MKDTLQPPDESLVQRITEAALKEFREIGEVKSVRCAVCGTLLELKRLGDKKSAVSIRCSCGRFHGALRGLLK
jgi:hypothetical protein